MKRIFLTLLLTMSSVSFVFCQSMKEQRMPLVGEPAPTFTAESTHGKITFPDDYYSKWKILFSCYADFTPVGASEIIELARMQEEWDKLETRIVVVLADGIPSHVTWVKSIEELQYRGNSTPRINFPLVSDLTLDVSKKYGMVEPNNGGMRDLRCVFIIDPRDKIRAIFVYPRSVGRNLEEIKRTLLALQLGDQKNILTPANWKPGEDVLIPPPRTEVDADKLSAKNDPGLQRVAWYMWFRKLK